MQLSQQQIKQHELKLLQISGFCLAQYAQEEKRFNIFRDISGQTNQKQLERLKTLKVKSTGVSANANLKAFLCVMLHSIYMGEVKEDLLDSLKSALYSEQMDLTSIKHHSLPSHSNQQLKKLVVQFFYSIKYSHFNDRVQSKIAKYPIILDILVVFVRKLLANFNIRNADDYIFHIPTQEAYSLLVQYFDINCRAQDRLYLFYQDRFFIFQNDQGEIMMGCYAENQNQQAEAQFRNPFAIQDLDEAEYEESEGEEKKQETPNRSLQLRGIVSESLVIDGQAPTPFFNFDEESLSSFKASKESSLVSQEAYQKDSMLKMSRDENLLKRMDRMQASQQLGLGSSLNMKKTIILQGEARENLNNNLKVGPFQELLDSPITMDSPHMLELPSDTHFNEVSDKIRMDGKDKVKTLKKSNSEKANKTFHSQVDHNRAKAPLKSQKSISRKDISKQTANVCHCVAAKKQKIGLNSRLYEVNMSFIQQKFNFTKKKPVTYVISSNSIDKCMSKPQHNRTVIGNRNQFLKGSPQASFFKKVDRVFSRNNPRDASTSQCSIFATQNPESETLSKRQFSPLSNNDRSLSPHGSTTKSITHPRVTFTYKNPMKYSARIKNPKDNNNYSNN